MIYIKENKIKKFIKTNRKMIIISLLTSIAISYLLGYSRAYRAFGGEDLIPIATMFYWLFKFIDEQERKNKNV